MTKKKSIINKYRKSKEKSNINLSLGSYWTSSAIYVIIKTDINSYIDRQNIPNFERGVIEENERDQYVSKHAKNFEDILEDKCKKASGIKTKRRKPKGRKTKGRKTKGRKTKGRKTKGRKTKGRKTKGRNTKGRKTKGRKTKGRKTSRS